jgi:hypothetical protein
MGRMGAGDPPIRRVEDLTLRPVRPADYDRIVEITQDVWEGRDYIPRVFERWVADSAASFQAAELEGEVVGVQRTRPFAPGLVWYEGLRVASSHHRQGIARAMLASAWRPAICPPGGSSSRRAFVSSSRRGGGAVCVSRVASRRAFLMLQKPRDSYPGFSQARASSSTAASSPT